MLYESTQVSQHVTHQQIKTSKNTKLIAGGSEYDRNIIWFWENACMWSPNCASRNVENDKKVEIVWNDFFSSFSLFSRFWSRLPKKKRGELSRFEWNMENELVDVIMAKA